jgi:hypothetical protein
MFFWIIFIFIAAALFFGFVVAFGPPYVPTLHRQVDAALDLLALEPGQTMLELGSGDGRVMRAAAVRGWKVVGIELNPLLVIFSYFLTFKYRKQVRIIWGSYWGAPWPRADAVFTFMLPRYMAKLDARLEKWRPAKIKLASFAFTIPGKEPIETRDGVYLYEYK